MKIIISFFIVVISFLCLCTSLSGQNPDWGTLIALEQAQYVVIAKMHVEDLQNGLGTLKILKVLKGDKKIVEAGVQFSDRNKKDTYTKHKESPKYFYYEGQEGIWLLNNKNNEKRFDLRIGQGILFYDKKWEAWIAEKLEVLKSRNWTSKKNGLAGSIIIDSIGNNKLYRFFNFCLRNDSNISLFINTHYRIKESSQSRFEAFIITPDSEKIDMINGNNSNCRLGGEPGWPTPTTNDFFELKPGKIIYLMASGDLKCFYKNPAKGIYSFHSSYFNDYISSEIKGKIWTGKISFPVSTFCY